MSLSSLVVRFEKFWECFKQPVFYNRILLGLKNTFIIALTGFIIGFLLGSLLAVLKLLPQNKKICRFFSKLTDVYVAIFRGTPIVVQLLVSFYFILPLIGVKADGITVCQVVFGLNSAAYVCEIMRGGILSVDKGQMEAGRALGLSYVTTMIRIVIPQAIKNILPTLGNELITLVKETSVVSFVGATDLFTAFNYIGSRNYEFMIPYLMMAIIYIVIIIILTLLIRLLERRLRAGDRR
ncbi:MAG: amino acid ABC transporter permease [Clostridia bacterium]|nr:amino acid ABC transporter permease [Clostridia bacterium]